MAPIHRLRVFGIRILAGVAAMLALASPGQASVIVQGSSFSIAGNLAYFQLAEFDPSLGTLDKVHVSVTGTLAFDMKIFPGQTVAPIVAVDALSLDGLGFDFLDDALLSLPSATNAGPCSPDDPCNPIIIPFVSAFSFSFDVTALSDLMGVVIAHTDAGLASPPIVGAKRADFIKDFVPLPILEALEFAPLGYAFKPFGEYGGGGAIIVTYDYTPPASAGEPGGGTAGSGTAVSEPATGALFVLAPGLLLLRRRAARSSQGAA